MNDFMDFLRSKDPKEEYNFMDCNGACLWGQYMASKGEKWSMNAYAGHASAPFGNTIGAYIASGPLAFDKPEEWTFGHDLKRAEKALEPA